MTYLEPIPTQTLMPLGFSQRLWIATVMLLKSQVHEPTSSCLRLSSKDIIVATML